MRLWIGAGVVLIVAVGLRVSLLDIRPMHGDEAIHAFKMGQLLDNGLYRYDPQDFHGPTLNYFTLVPAWLAGRTSYVSLDVWTLRLVPVFFGVLLVLMPLLLADALGGAVVLLAAAFTAISPAFVFYSRYYIHEMLLVCFTFGIIACAYRYARTRKVVWALLTGVFLGLSHATKETSVIAFAAMLLAVLLTVLIDKRRLHAAVNALATLQRLHLVAGFVVALVVSGLLYSSFLDNLPGLVDSVRTYATNFNKAGHNVDHIAPWYSYLKILVFQSASTGPGAEILIVLLAVAGATAILLKKGVAGLDSTLLDFLVFYTLLMTVAYSAIPYKTPWCLLSFHHGMVLLAGVGAVAVLKLLRPVPARLTVGAFLITAAAHLALQAYLGSSVFSADLSNPYVYSQPTSDVLEIADRVERLSRAYPGGREMPVIVLCPEDDYWPLPWYLRAFKNVEWMSDVGQLYFPAPLVIAAAQFEGDLFARMDEFAPPGQKHPYAAFFDKYLALRPELELRGYATKDLLERYRRLVAISSTPANTHLPAGR